MRVFQPKDIQNKRVIIRADLDVPIKNGLVEDDFRLQSILPTIRKISSLAEQTTIIGHLGRPKDKDPQKSLKPVHQYLEDVLKQPIQFLKEINSETDSGIRMLENLRYWEGEKNNNPTFAAELAKLGEVYINESFANAHREHASIVGIPKHLPAYAGLRLNEEVENIENFWLESDRPIAFLLGGAKTDKTESMNTLVNKADLSLVGGVFMFEKPFGDNPKIFYGIDDIDQLDIGPESIKQFQEKLDQAKTVLWNGPVGKFEDPKYEQGTKQLATTLANLAQSGRTKVVVGGGNTIAALKEFGVLGKMSFVSTGGGAMLELLCGTKLPGVLALD